MSLELARQYYNLKNFGFAKKELELYIELDSKDSQAYYLMGMILQKIGEQDLSENYFTICLELNPSHRNCLIQLGQVLLQHQKYEQARSLLEKYKKNNSSWRCQYLLGKICEAEGQFAKAVNYYRNSLEINPRNVKCLRSQFKLRKKMSKYEQTKQYSVQMLKKKEADLQKQKQLIEEQKRIIEKWKSENTETVSVCVICIEQKTSYANKQCGHQLACEKCVKLLKNQCPICKTTGNFIKIYKV